MQKNYLTNKTILIVEDDKFNLILLEEFLKDPGVKILTVTTGIDAIEIVKKNNSIDLILMDLTLPIMNGYDASIEIKKYNKNLPIVAQTASVIPKENKNFNPSIFDDYICKPFKKEELLNKIKKILST